MLQSLYRVVLGHANALSRVEEDNPQPQAAKEAWATNCLCLISKYANFGGNRLSEDGQVDELLEAANIDGIDGLAASETRSRFVIESLIDMHQALGSSSAFSKPWSYRRVSLLLVVNAANTSS